MNVQQHCCENLKC